MYVICFIFKIAAHENKCYLNVSSQTGPQTNFIALRNNITTF